MLFKKMSKSSIF